MQHGDIDTKPVDNERLVKIATGINTFLYRQFVELMQEHVELPDDIYLADFAKGNPTTNTPRSGDTGSVVAFAFTIELKQVRT